MVQVVHYVAEDGTDYFDMWLRTQLREVRARIQTRIDRVELGNFGDHKSVGKGVSELRVTFGTGYRIYYGRDGDTLVILLGGGTKDRQGRDIDAAQARWQAYKQERRHARQSPSSE
jgi:putative addiction module killer protein